MNQAWERFLPAGVRARLEGSANLQKILGNIGWLVADRMQLAMFFGISAAKIQLHPESIPHPKEYLLRLAASAKAEIRRDLLPKDGALALQGFGYNERLTEFVDNFWSPTRAGAVSPSLKKAISRLETWMTTIPPTQRV